MDTGLLHNNHMYYDGFEGEDEVVLSLISDPEISIHVWIGYLEDILQKPALDSAEWKGFSRDYHQLKGAFSENDEGSPVEPAEYLEDIQHYANRTFDEAETIEVYRLIKAFLEYAVQNKSLIKIQVI